MIDVFTFDVFPLGDHVDFGFSPTDAWSVNFELLKYESINFIECMGSIIIIVWVGVLFILLAAMVFSFKCKIKFKWLRNQLKPLSVWYSILGFFQGTFFELLICLSVSMKVMENSEFFNGPDKFSVTNQMIVAFGLMVFIGFVTYFTIFVMPKVYFVYVSDKLFEQEEKIDETR